jgi:hypothetical protein
MTAHMYWVQHETLLVVLDLPADRLGALLFFTQLLHGQTSRHHPAAGSYLMFAVPSAAKPSPGASNGAQKLCAGVMGMVAAFTQLSELPGV